MRLAVLLLSLGVAAPAIAQQPSVDESLDEEGRALFAAGRAAFGAERFEDALRHFQAAYDRSRRPELLYNVALAADRLGRAELALETYEKYLDSVPNSPFANAASERVSALQAAGIEPTRTEPVEPIEPIEPAHQPIPIVDTAPPEPTPEPEPQPQPQHEHGRSLRVPGFVLLGGGAAALVAGLGLIGSAVAAKSNVEETLDPLWDEDLQKDYDAASRRSTAGIVLGAVGVAAAASGLLMLLVGPRDDSIALDIGPRSLSLRGRF